MKTSKYLFLALILAIVTTSGHAQNRNFKFGIKAGANLSRLKGGDVVSSSDPNVKIGNTNASLTGFVGGVFVRLGSSIYLQPELLLSQKGGTVNIFRSSTSSMNNSSVDLRFTNFDVPVMVGLRFGDFFRINAGPIASLRLSENGGLRQALNEVGANSVKDNYNSAALGYQAGVGVDIGNLSVDLRYEGNTSNIINADTDDANFNSQLKRKGSLWQATVGFAIF
ncbi:porin family protein [Persicitalea sp.]|uniref:porin family protein n=1 Tax=Persicitalea sp. TaxID=3100273 RepID=UPI003593BFCC